MKLSINKYAVFATIWTSLGAKRGADLYDYEKNVPSLYSDKCIYCLVGGIIYLNPLLSLLTLHKELYRVEINIRNIKKDPNYYDLF